MPADGRQVEIDTTNEFMVGVQGDRVVVMMDARRPMTPDQAIRFAAWLVVNAESIKLLTGQQSGPMFSDYTKAIEQS